MEKDRRMRLNLARGKSPVHNNLQRNLAVSKQEPNEPRPVRLPVRISYPQTDSSDGHTRSCASLIGDDCTCSLKERTYIEQLRQQLTEAKEELERLKADLNIARACKPDEFTHVVASERMAHEGKRNAEAELSRLTADNERLKLRLLSAAGDDLCRLTQEEIKAYTSCKVQIPPKEEFLPSCERFHEQISSEAGVLKGCLTLAQLIAENQGLETTLDKLKLRFEHPDEVVAGE